MDRGPEHSVQGAAQLMHVPVAGSRKNPEEQVATHTSPCRTLRHLRHRCGPAPVQPAEGSHCASHFWQPWAAENSSGAQTHSLGSGPVHPRRLEQDVLQGSPAHRPALSHVSA